MGLVLMANNLRNTTQETLKTKKAEHSNKWNSAFEGLRTFVSDSFVFN